MRRLLTTGSFVALAIGFSLPVLAQTYGPPTGFEGMTAPPAGYENMMPPSDAGASFGPPAGIEQMQQKGLERLKKGTQSMQKAVTQMEKTIDKVLKAGYAVPAEVTDSLAKGKAAIATIQAATAFDDSVETALDDFNSFVDMLDQNIEEMNFLANFPRILKQAERTLPKLINAFDKQKVKVEKSGMDLGATVTEIQGKIDAMKAALEKAKASAQSGKAIDAFNTLENEFFGGIEDTFQSVGMLQAALNISKAVKSVEKGIAKAEKITAQIKSKGKDVTELNTIIQQSKAKLDELKAMIKVKGFEPEPAVDLLDQLNDLRDQFETKAEEISGKDLYGASGVSFFSNPTTLPTMPKELKQGLESKEGASGVEKFDSGSYGF